MSVPAFVNAAARTENGRALLSFFEGVLATIYWIFDCVVETVW